ncbi:MAG: metallophosphoesterase, partial [Bacteroidia bacterium]|nr:metallophosphoesterase [Bacteroidia bacterium]
MILRWLIFILIFIAVDIYAFQAVRTVTNNKWIHLIYAIISIGALFSFIYYINVGESIRTMTTGRMFSFGVITATFVPKLFVLVIVLFGEDLVRLSVGLFSKIAGSSESFYIPSRRKFVSTIALGIAAVPFAGLLYGMLKGKYNYKVLSYELEFDDLPDAFDGYKITQISDIHSGSFDSAKKVKYGVDLI